MNENLNLCEILKDTPKGTKLYTSIFGEVEFRCICNEIYSIETIRNDGAMVSFMSDGRYWNYPTSECLLFPSKDQRNWNVWKEEQNKKKLNTIKEGDYGITPYKEIYRVKHIKDSDYCLAIRVNNGITCNYPIKDLTKINKYPVEHFQPFDRVLVRNKDNYIWNIQCFERLTKTPEYKFYCICSSYVQCIPYNEETKHLLGTTEKAPEFYINW